MRVCTCVCTYVYMCARVCTRVYCACVCIHICTVCTCVCVCRCLFVCVHVCVDMCVHVHVCIHVYCSHVFAYTRVFVHICMCIRVYMCVHMFCMYTVCLCVQVCVHTCVCTHAHPRALCFLKAFASLGGFDQKDCIGPSFSLPDTGVKQPLAAGLAKDTPLDGKLLSKGDTVSQGWTPHSPGSRPPLARAAHTGREGPARPSFSLFPSDRLADSYFPEGP